MAAKNSRTRKPNSTCKHDILKGIGSRSNENLADFVSVIENLVELSI